MIIPRPIPSEGASDREWALYLARRAAANNNAALAEKWDVMASTFGPMVPAPLGRGNK